MKKINKFGLLLILISICITLQCYILFGGSNGKSNSAKKGKYDIPTVEGWPPEKSRDLKLYISNPVTGPNNICDWRKANSSPLKMLIIVKTATAYLSRRKVIRETWADPELLPEGVKVIFMVGVDHRTKIHEMIEIESEKHCDIVQVRN